MNYLKVVQGAAISYEIAASSRDIYRVQESMFINLNTMDIISFEECYYRCERDCKEETIYRYKVSFERFVDEGIWHCITLYFVDERDETLETIKKMLGATNMANHNVDITNKNKGTKGTNITYDKNQGKGNRGKQMNPNWTKGS